MIILLRTFYIKTAAISEATIHQTVSQMPEACINAYLNIILSRSKGYSMMPVVGTRTRKMSCSVGK